MNNRKAERERWREVHNRKPGEPKDTMFHYELRTAEETASILGITRQRVQQIERSALFKLRRGLKDFYEEHYKRQN